MFRYLKYTCLFAGILCVAIVAITQHSSANMKCEREWIHSQENAEMPALVAEHNTPQQVEQAPEDELCDDAPSASGAEEVLSHEPHLLILNLFFWL